MSNLSYPECIRALYESEIFGEAVFLALVNVAKNPRERYHFATLLQLETETKARLRPFLFAHGISLDEKMDLAGVNQAVEGYTLLSWQEFAAINMPVVQDFLSQFEAIASAGPEEDQIVLRSMIHHETAILKWLKMESQGTTQGSLADVIAQLHFPLPAPHDI